MDKGLLVELKQEAEHTDKLVVVRSGIPTPIDFKDDGTPVWSIEGGADGIFYRDSRQPFIFADQTAITLSTTNLNLFPGALTILPANYWWVGKTVKLTLYGKYTSDATTANVAFGAAVHTANPPTAIAVSAAVAGTVSKTNFTFKAQAYFTCRSVGATGTVMAMGDVDSDPTSLLASTLSPLLIPQSAPATFTVDTTSALNSATLTMSRTGAGVWSATTVMLFFEALN